jgi:hypothetical protein
MISVGNLLLHRYHSSVIIALRRVSDIMKAKALVFALFMGLFSLSGCVASLGGGPDYGYYPPARPYYGYARPYYAPRPIIIVPKRGYYRGGNGYRGDDGYHRGGGGGGGNGYGGGDNGGGRGHHGRD